MNLGEIDILERPGGTGQDDQAGDGWIGLGDPRGKHAAQAMAQDEDALGIDVPGLAKQRDGGQDVLDRLLLDGKRRNSLHLRLVRLRAFLVAQHRDPLGGQTPGQVAEGLVGPDGLIAIVGS